MKRYRLRVITVSILFEAIALAVSWLIFEMRYMWYVKSDDFEFLRNGFAGGAAIIVLLWLFYPSRILVGLTGMAIFVFPPLFDRSRFVPVDGAFFVWSCGALLLFLLATELRRRAISSREHGVM